MAVKKNKTEAKKSYAKEIRIALRVVFSIVFFIAGYNFSHSRFFNEYPLFGWNTIIEGLFSVLSAWFGFFVFPKWLKKLQTWMENLIIKTVSDIVSEFWSQQSKSIQNARREKQKRKAAEEKAKLKRDMEKALVLDTSVLIDGRIVDIVKAGFVDTNLIVAQSVIDELQKVADNKNKVKRLRGRRGLDIIKELKKSVKILNPVIKTKTKEVDKQLVEYAKEHGLKLMTLDYNMNKVAKIFGVKVLNINDLANALRTIMLPSEEFVIKIIQRGKEKKQGIGYLEDGTMIVVENANDKVGQEVKVKVSKMIQSSAGKMIFCEPLKEKP